MSFKSTRQGSMTGSSLMDKPKAQMRGPTPENEAAVASSDDDHERPSMVPRPPQGHPFSGRRPSQSWLQDIQPRKFSLPTEAFPVTENAYSNKNSGSAVAWNTTSFTSPTNNSQSRLKEIVPSPTTVVPGSERALPSPTHQESDDGIGFLLNQGPTRKSVRSQSYSVGQHEADHTLPTQVASRNRLLHRPSKPSMLGGDPALGLVREDDVDEVESPNGSEQGSRLPSSYWEPQTKQPTGALLKQAAENARSRHRATSTSSPVSQYPKKVYPLRSVARTDSDYAIEEVEDLEAAAAHLSKLALTRRFSENVATAPREPDADYSLEMLRRQHWASSSNLGSGMDPLSRRHSFATVGVYNNSHPLQTLGNTYEEDEGLGGSSHTLGSPLSNEHFDPRSYFTGYGPGSRALKISEVSSAHPAPMAEAISGPNNPYAVPAVVGRPGKRLYIVTFKCARADIYYVYDNTGLQINCGDLVIVEGDRGHDLGQVTHTDITPEQAKKLKAEANDEHFKWLITFSYFSLQGNPNEQGMLGALARAFGGAAGRAPTVPAMAFSAQPEQESKPKMIKRLAADHEIARLKEKEGQEAKAKRIGIQKAAEHSLPMEILDAEYQMDNHKLTYFYYADSYVNFNDLVTDLFKQYKVRIWMSAVNPASVVNPAGVMQMPHPSAIGPGAIIHQSQSASASLPVGPGFGSSAYNTRVGATVGQTYDEGFYSPFSQQLPVYPGQAQAGYGMQWGQNSQPGPDTFNRYNPYPVAATGYSNASGSGTPVNYGGYYPPAPLSSSPAYQGTAGNQASYGAAAYSGAPHGPGYGAHANAHNGLPPTTAGYGAHANSHSGPPPTTVASSAGPTHSNGNWGVQGYDDTFRRALHKLSLNKQAGSE